MSRRGIYYDTETTGVKADSDRIVEIAAYDPVNDRTFVELVNPQCPIPKEAAAVHHITDEMVANAPTFGEVAQRFVEFCGEEVYLIAHNNDGFDKHFLRYEFQRAAVELPPWPYIDTLKWARKYRPDLPRHALQFLREVFGIEANNAHRALDDVMMLHQIFSIMIDDLPLDKVYELMAGGLAITSMPFGKHKGTPLADVPKNYLSWLQESGALDKPDNADLKAALEKL